MTGEDGKDDRYLRWVFILLFGLILLVVGINSSISSLNISNEVTALIGLVITGFSGIQLGGLVVNIIRLRQNQAIQIQDSQVNGGSIIQAQRDVVVQSVPASGSSHEFDALDGFRIALAESQRLVRARTVFTSQGSIEQIDQRIEVTISKFNEASIYFDQADFKIMENAWLNQKKFVGFWMYGVQYDIRKDVDELDEAYRIANERLREILRALT